MKGFHVNKSILGGANVDIVGIAKWILYQMTFIEICKLDVPNFEHSYAGSDSVKFWHHRLKHLDVKSIYILQSMVRGITLGKISHSTSTLVCETCMDDQQYATEWGYDAEKLVIIPSKIMHLGV